MSGQLVLGPGVQAVGFESYDPTEFDQAHSGKGHARKLAGQVWKVTLRWPPLKRAEFRDVFAALLVQRGRFSIFTVILPELSTPDGVATGVPVVNGAGQTGSSLAVRGLTPNVTGIMLALDCFKLAGGTKVYQLTAPANTDAFGNAVFQFVPPLRTAPVDGEVVTITNVPFTMRLDSDRLQTERSRGLYTLEASMTEDVV